MILPIIGHLLLATLVIVVNVAIQAEMFNAFNNRLERLIQWLRRRFHRFANTVAVVLGVLFVMLVITAQVWVWTATFLIAGAITGLEPALYFTLTCFTTAGFGDITLNQDWRLLSALTAANGFISFGWSTAYMVELVRRTT